MAAALNGPLAWEPPYAAGAALEKAKKNSQGKLLMEGTLILDEVNFPLQSLTYLSENVIFF